ncbi:mechanosensitive ion channel family protein [Marinobacter bohaiensis]|uniref:mechanosensitive ion channel family protein n=1 Tax=Marinobacter bohaiensis TaxID=2201898 RepID=UPI0013A698DC|nr:mechanosensitive ion channel domain-containing protein [Marinobacter bohaiensis]
MHNGTGRSIRHSLATLIAAATLWFLACPALAQETAPDPSQIDTASVNVDGRPLFRIAGTASFPAAERAANIRRNILEVASDHTVAVDSIRSIGRDGRVEIAAAQTPLLTVFPVDAMAEGAPLEEVAEAFQRRTADAITRYRNQRSSDYLATASMKAGAALVLTLALLWLALFLYRRLLAFLDQHYRRRVQDLKIESFELVRADNIWAALTGFIRFLRIATVLVVAYLGLEFVLYQFPWTHGTARTLLTLFTEPVVSIVSAFLDYLPELVFLVVLVAVSRYLLKLMQLFFRGIERGRIHIGGFEAEWAQPTYKLLRFFVVLLTVVLAYPYIPGSGSAAFQGLSILLGIMVSLGASSAVSSVVAGYAMTYRRAFSIGDVITVGEYTGTVRETRLLVTHLRTFRNEEIVLPNSLILNSPVTNLTRSAAENGLMLSATVGIGYETPWRQVEAMLKEAAARTRGLLEKPAPFVLEKALGDFAVTYELNVSIDSPAHRFYRAAELHRHVLDVFNEYGVAIMTPAYISDPDEPKLVPQERWYAAPARPPDESGNARDST